MKFINRGKSVQVRIDTPKGYNWVILYPGKTIDLPHDIGLRYGFEEVNVTKGKIGKVEVETKQIDSKKIKEKNGK